MLTPERRKEIATAAAKARWEAKAPTTRITLTVRKTDHEGLERLMVALGEPSHGAVVRRLIRQALKALPKA